MIRHFSRLTYRLTLLLIILSGIMVALARLLTPLADSYREDVEIWAAEALGQPVTVGFLEAHWRGVGPRFILHNIELIDPTTKEATLQLSEIGIDINLIDSLRNGAITSRRITLANPDLLIKRRTDGSFSIEGLEGLEALANADEAIEDAGGLFLLPKRIAVTNGRILWENQAIGAAPLRFTNVNLELHNDGNRHQLSGHLAPQGAIDSKLTLAADIIGDLQQPGAWSGRFYLSGDNLILNQLLKHRIPEGYTLPSGQAHAELWSEWEEGRMQRLEGDIRLEDVHINQLKLAEDQTSKEWKADTLGGQFQWLRQPRGWQLEIADILVRNEQSQWPQGSLSIQTDLDDEGQQLVRAGADFLRIQDVLSFITLFPLPDLQMEQALKTLNPVGDLHDLRLDFTDTEERDKWRFTTKAKALTAAAWRKLPGISNINAEVRASESEGVIALDSRNTLIDTSGLFRAPLRVERLKGNLNWWRNDDGGWNIESQSLTAENGDIKTTSRLQLKIPNNTDESVFMDLQTDFRDGNSENAGRYYPTAIMPKQVVSWLDRGIGKGRVTSGSCLIRGPLKEFPFHKTQGGRFEILFNVADLQLDYQEGWPALSGINAEVRFLNNQLDIWANSGRIYDSQIQQAHGKINNLINASQFKLKGKVSGPMADTLRLLNESPLSRKFGPMVQGIEASGPSSLALDFAVPLKEKASERLAGTLHFQNSSLNLSEWELPLTDINGKLTFDLDQIKGDGILGKLNGNPISVDVAPTPDNPNSTRITARAILPMQNIKQRFNEFNLQPLNGQGEWNLQLDIPHLASKSSTIHIQISSDLQGIEIDLPSPMGKSAGESRELFIATSLGASAESRLRVDYGNLLSTSLLIDSRKPEQPKLLRGEVRLGAKRALLPTTPGLQILGGWRQFDLEPWLDYWEKREGEAQAVEIKKVDLKFDQLSMGDLALKQARIAMQNNRNGWHGQVSSDRFKGTLQIPLNLDQQPIKINLDKLELNLDPDQWSSEKQAEKSVLDPTSLPAIVANIRQLRLNDKDYGSFKFNSKKLPDGIQIDQLSINAKQIQLSANGRWIKRKSGEQHTSLISSLNSPGFGKLLSDLGFEANLKKAPAEIEAQLNWPGSPLDFSKYRLNGQLSMQVDSGRFMDVNPGVGRVFGLLNLGALQRRLTLDFSDVLKKGLAFDSIEGDFLLEEGDAYTHNFKMRGPAASIEIAGRIGLGSEDFDQLVTVTPQISSNLPLAGAFAGGPAVGAALFLAQKLVGKQFDKVTQIQYIVTGPWADPNIRKKLPEQDDNEPYDQIPPFLPEPEPKDQDTGWVLPTPDGRPRFYLTDDKPSKPWKDLDHIYSTQMN